jgi:hypothetical protein
VAKVKLSRKARRRAADESQPRVLGSIVIDEKWHFLITGVRLFEGQVAYVGKVNGPQPGCKGGEMQIVIYGEDGTEINRGVTKFHAWHDVPPGDHLRVVVPVYRKDRDKPW